MLICETTESQLIRKIIKLGKGPNYEKLNNDKLFDNTSLETLRWTKLSAVSLSVSKALESNYTSGFL